MCIRDRLDDARVTDLVSDLSADERQDHFQNLATDEGKKVQDIALRRLTEGGFDVTHKGTKIGRTGLQYDFVATSNTGDQWYVDVAGAFHTSRPGLQRADILWKTLGKIQVLQAVEPGARVIVLTSALPRPGNEADRSLRAVGPSCVFDAIELYDEAGLDRLRAYANGAHDSLTGFWTDADLADRH